MTRPGAKLLTTAALVGLASALLLLVGPCSDDDDGATERTCTERRLATATGFVHDPALAIAISRAVELDHPELSGIVDAVADYQQAHPEYGTFEPDIHDRGGGVSLNYIAVLLSLADHPELATPEMLTRIEQLAEMRGMVEVVNFMENARRYPEAENGGVTLEQLRRLVDGQETAVQEAGIQFLPPALCENPPRS